MPDVEKFIKLMMMTTSSHDNEALVALRMANAMLAEMDANWEEFIKGVVPNSAWAQQHQSQNYHAQGPRPRPQASASSGDELDVPYTMTKAGKKIYKVHPKLDEAFAFLDGQIKGGFRDFFTSVYDFYEDKGFITEKQYAVIKRSYDQSGAWSNV